MQKYGLLGHNISYSLSPIMHQAAFNYYDINATYELIDLTIEELHKNIPYLKETYQGFNITVPYKKEMLQYMDTISTLGNTLQSINTVCNKNNTWEGTSTDPYGVEMSLINHLNQTIEGTNFVFLGAGGAVQASAISLALKKANKITIINRTLAKAQQICTIINKLTSCQSQALDFSNKNLLSQAYEESTVIIQGTKIGTNLNDPSLIDSNDLNKKHKIIDMVYKNTKLLQDATKKNINCIDGRYMLLYQGAKSWELWTHKKAPINIMLQALNKKLNT